MTLDELLFYLRQKNINLWIEGDRLRYRASAAVMTPDLLAEVRKYKTEVMAFLREADTHTHSASPVIRPAPRQTNNLSLSFAQEPLWFLHQLQPGNVSDHLSGGFRLSGPLDVAALEMGLNEIIRRHEALRTTFVSMDGQPAQVIAPDLTLTLSMVNLQGSGETEEAEIQRLATEELQKPFDLTQGPLFRAKLLRLGDEEHVLLLTMHHIVSDGWSFGVLYRELAVLYEAFSIGRKPSPLSDLPVQYADFALWQRQWLKDEVLGAQLSYWKEQLNGDLPVLGLPTDRPRPALQTFRGAKRFLSLPKKLYEALKALSQREGCTLFMTLVGAIQTLLCRYTGQDDIIVGVPISQRHRPELEGLIALFLNMVVLRTDLSGNPSSRELLGRVREVTLGAYAHQDLPFEKLVEELRPERDLSRNPLFQVMFQLSQLEKLELPGLSIVPLEFDSGTAQFDLSIHLWEGPEGLRGHFGYNSDLFDAATINRMVGHFQTLLEGIVSNPQQCISELPILTEVERQQLLVEWNDTLLDYPKGSCIHELFEAQAARTSDAIAVVFEEEQLTYRELNQRANQLAHYLQKLGVGPEVLVGICVDRSLEMLVGSLGILKAGGAYVPLDPSFPSERLAYMLEDAQVSVLLTHSTSLGQAQQRLVEGLPEHGAKVVCLDADWEAIAQESIESPVSEVNSEHLVYVIYTSGSTGKPKGVQIPHGALVNFLIAMRHQPGLTDQDVLLAVTTLSFDIAGLELFLPLIAGARTVLVSRETASDGTLLLKRLAECGATVMQATPSTWRLLLAADWRDHIGLKMLCGGEALPRELANQLLERGNSLWNMYGPTETTIWSSVNEVESTDGPVLIGPPIANTQFYVLDPNLQPVPIGIPGELHIGGDGLARGYLNRPELTKERFIANPFSNEESSRIYKTGDLVRFLPDGNIEFLGRLDHQVKVRGFRIELGEIENTLSQHPVVREVVVVTQEGEDGDTRLVAYLVPKEGETPSISLLRSYSKEKLPEYMVPSLFVMLQELPLTPNDKIDRKALPKPDLADLKSETAYVASRDTVELQLTNIWKKILGIKTIGIKDNFFELGGHSLLAAQLVAQIEKNLGRRIPLATLFQAPTIEQLADILRKEEWEPNWSSLVAIQAGGSKPPLFLVHGAEGNILLYRELAHYLGPGQPVYGLQSQGLDGNMDFETRIESMASHYIKEMKSLQPEGPYHLGGYCLGGTIAFEMAQQLQAQGEKAALLAMFETYNVQSRPKAPSRFLRLCHQLQNVKFHVGNLLLIRTRDKVSFFRGKSEVTKSRAELRIRIGLSKLAHRLSSNNRHSYPHALIDKVNDQAQREYLPKAYPGRVTLLRPRRYFAGFNDPQFGWGGLVDGGMDIHELPVNPRGMLVEPFVQILADKLRESIQKALESASSQ